MVCAETKDEQGKESSRKYSKRRSSGEQIEREINVKIFNIEKN